MLLGNIGAVKKRLIAFLLVLAAVLAVLFFLAGSLNAQTIRKGVAIEGIDVSGLKTAEARMLLSDSINSKYPGGTFTLRLDEREWKYGLSEISYEFLVDDAIAKAFSMGRTGNVFQKLYQMADMAFNGRSFEVVAIFDRNKLADILKKIKAEVDQEETNAAIAYEKDGIKLSEHRTGKYLDIDINVDLVENQFRRKNFNAINLELKELKPEITYDDIKSIDSVLSFFHTSFSTSDKNRSDNIRLACSRINGKILMPGDMFSMNEALGPRTIENGYKEAPVIYKNELIKGPGGGICQVTTTLYNAVLMAKLQVIERSPHSMPLGYVKPGQDATIAEGTIDFKFQNGYDFPVSLAAEVKGSKINIRILGNNSMTKHTVKLVSVITQLVPYGQPEIEIDDSLGDEEIIVDKEARNGIRATLYRDTYSEDDLLVERETISKDYYKPVNALIKMNRYYYNKYYLLEGFPQ